MPRPSNRDVRRAQIVSALLRLLPAKGYRGTSIAAVAKEAGLTPGLIHYHFKTKEEILVAAVEVIESALHARIADRRRGCANEPDLDSILYALLAPGNESDTQHMHCWLMFAHEASQSTEVGRVFGKALESLRRELEGAVTVQRESLDTGAHDFSPADVALVLLSTVQGMYQVGVTAPDYLLGRAFELARGSAMAMVHQKSKS